VSYPAIAYFSVFIWVRFQLLLAISRNTVRNGCSVAHHFTRVDKSYPTMLICKTSQVSIWYSFELFFVHYNDRRHILFITSIKRIHIMSPTDLISPVGNTKQRMQQTWTFVHTKRVCWCLRGISISYQLITTAVIHISRSWIQNNP
jgi:hypothetical protein